MRMARSASMHVRRLRVGVGEDRDRFDAHLAAGADDPDRDLAAVGDQNRFNIRLSRIDTTRRGTRKAADPDRLRGLPGCRTELAFRGTRACLPGLRRTRGGWRSTRPSAPAHRGAGGARFHAAGLGVGDRFGPCRQQFVDVAVDPRVQFGRRDDGVHQADLAGARSHRIACPSGTARAPPIGRSWPARTAQSSPE